MTPTHFKRIGTPIACGKDSTNYTFYIAETTCTPCLNALINDSHYPTPYPEFARKVLRILEGDPLDTTHHTPS